MEKPTTMYTACLLLIIAAILQCCSHKFTCFNAALLLLGVTSVIHHSRLDTWFINDPLACIDRIMCFVVAYLGWKFYKSPLWIAACILSALIIGSMWFTRVNPAHRHLWHGGVHVFICIVLVFLTFA